MTIDVNRRQFLIAGIGAALAIRSTRAQDAKVTNPFYAMDTSFARPGLTTDQQFDLVKDLGYAGVAWTQEPLEKLSANLQKIEQRGLKMFTIYCGANVTPTGELKLPPELPKLMTLLKGHGTVIWLHIGGKGPDFAKLTPQDPLVTSLRSAADMAKQNDLRIAIYPHFGEWTAHFGDATQLAKVVDHDRFGVTFNLCHTLAVGDEAKIPALLDSAKDKLFTATICGADTGAQWGRLIQTLDKGTFDNAALLRKLHQIGFAGPIGFQGFGINADARSILTPTMNAWKKLISQAER